MAEEDYESDPEEAKLSLGMRRRRASDDEDEGRDSDGEAEASHPRPLSRSSSRIGIDSGGESDGQGGVEEYDDEEEEEGDEEEVDDDEEGYGDDDDDEEDEEEGFEEERVDANGGISHGRGADVAAADVAVRGVGTVELEGQKSGMVAEPLAEGEGAEHEHGVEGEEEEKKEHEPFAVPTAGAFYMHDDRFRDSSGGRHRRTLGGRKLWESKDERKWGHDKFEEMSLHEKRYEEGRRIPKGQYRARGRNRGADRGDARGSRGRMRASNQTPDHAPKVFRGRGPRRYQPPSKDGGQAPQTQNKHPGKLPDKSSQTSSHRVSVSTSNGGTDSIPSRNQVFGSSLSSASPPFYPSGSSNKEVTMPQKKNVQAVVTNQNSRVQVMDERFSMSQSSSALLRGKNIVDTMGMDKLYIDNSVLQRAGKPLTNMQLPPSGLTLNNTAQHPRPRPQGRVLAHSGQMNFQPNVSHNEVSRGLPTRNAATQQSPVQNRAQNALQPSAQTFSQHSIGGSQASSQPETSLSVNSFEPPGENESSSEQSKSRTALVSKGRGAVQGSGRGTFPYGGPQAMGPSGNMGVGRGDQNFPRTPAFLPVMQFGGQHPGGIGVPAVGMAFPGYVAQPQLGMGNSEMTWLPVLAGAAGALGATYCPPYMAVDGAFQGRPSGRACPPGTSSKETSTSKPNNERKPSQGPEIVSDEFGQRQNKPRRYSEMSFGQ